MSIEKYKLIIDGLITKTDENQLKWRETAEDDTFQVSFSNHSITLSARRSVRGTRYVIGILNAEGKNVGSFSSSDLDDFDADERVAGLYERARRQALGADNALDEILTQLSGSH